MTEPDAAIDADEAIDADGGRPPDPPELDRATERALAVGLYNRVWPLLGAGERTAEQLDELIHTAHASRHHWARVGSPYNLARGEWLCSRVYAVLGRGEPALWHARRCLAILEAGGSGEDWDLAAAYEALARAHAVAGERAAALEWRARAAAAAASIAELDDREVIEADLASLPL